MSYAEEMAKHYHEKESHDKASKGGHKFYIKVTHKYDDYFGITPTPNYSFSTKDSMGVKQTFTTEQIVKMLSDPTCPLKDCEYHLENVE